MSFEDKNEELNNRNQKVSIKNVQVKRYADEMMPSDIVGLIKDKADDMEVKRLGQVKVNKDDFADQMHAIDIIHRQISHLAVLLLE